ncbi:hypothetical protein F5Y16DRAFT_404302 [Xylariaceae sp. FL0255]|nr:hypothetical protein F5Y16DRAFT_404302 [Xylariaceae sp. FL0255]
MAGVPPPSAPHDLKNISPANTQADQLPDSDLNAAILHFAPQYMREKLERLAQECDQRLERDLVPQLQHLLRQIDDERRAFEEQKRELVQDLQSRLKLLRFDDDAVKNAIRQLRSVESRFLHLLPTAASLAAPVSTNVGVSISDRASGPIGRPHTSIETASISLNREITESAPPPYSSTSAVPAPSFERELQAQVSIESATASQSPKRPRTEKSKDADKPSKRQKNNEPHDGAKSNSAEITREVAFPNLETGECIFRHSQHEGYFVIRCDHCDRGTFTEPPLAYNRALKHFQRHNFTRADGEELTNEDIFDQFAYRVCGEGMASKYWIREHLGAAPHIYVPNKATRASLSTDELEEDMMRKHKEIDDDFYPPFPQARESPRSRSSDQGQDLEKPRRPLRNVPRPDYKEMVAGKDPWDALAEVDSERTFTTIQVTHSTSSSKRRLVKPESPEKQSMKAKPMEPKK